MTPRRAITTFGPLLLLLAATFVLLAARESRQPDPTVLPDSLLPVSAEAVATTSHQPTVTRTDVDRLRWGDNLANAFGRQVPERERVNRLVEAFAAEVDLRRVPAGAEIEYGWSDTELLYVQLADPRDDFSVVRVLPDPSGYRAERVALPADTTLVWYHGTVESSVYEAILERGGTAELAIKFFEIFQFTHYFAIDTRRGDRYSMLVEEIHRDGERISYGQVFAARYTGSFDTLTAVWRPEGAGGEFFSSDGLSFRRDLLRVPFPAARITSTYGVRKHPVTGRVRVHHGVDLAADRGTPVVAAGKGTVTKVGRGHPGYGNWVHIRHGKTGFETRYGHFQSIARGIRVGSKVEQGTVVGYVGSTGLATGPHLHYEVFRGGQRMNPLRVKGSPVQKLAEKDRQTFLAAWYVPLSYLLDSGEAAGAGLPFAGTVEPPGISPWPTLLAAALFGQG